MADTIIQAKALTHTFHMGSETIHALRQVDMDVAEGEFVAVVGPSGSGKSTLLYILGALEDPTAGELSVDGQAVASLTEHEKAEYRNRKVGFVFQDFNLMGHMSALENVELPLKYTGATRAQRRRRASEALDAVGLSARIRHRPGELSSGERQRVAIARAVVTEPRILLADEPTGNLDSKTGSEVVGLLRELCEKRGLTLVVVTHNERVSAAAGRRLTLIDGRIEED
jgi:putative ABC transport system ATP-binding protein